MEKNHDSRGGNGKLSVVGTGPGSLKYLTPAARDAIEKADIVVGYKTYLGLIEEILPGKEIHSSSMMQEVDRVQNALDLAEGGQKVALVSGGDPGIYAMAGLAFEIAAERESTVEIQIVAGIAALNSCAERLGAPLMHDFAAISLSDLLTPWEVIERRITAVAAADFVIVLYNPRSRKRDWQLGRAIELVAEYRDIKTPVGYVKGSTRDNESVNITTIEELDPSAIDMQTTVIIGNSNTFCWNDKMITPRGYKNKYQLD